MNSPVNEELNRSVFLMLSKSESVWGGRQRGEWEIMSFEWYKSNTRYFSSFENYFILILILEKLV